MRTDGIGGASSLRNLHSLFSNLEGGKTNISKDDLSNIKNSITSEFDDLINSFDTVDLNGDGLSMSELQSYTGFSMNKGLGHGQPPDLSKDEMTAMRDKIASETGEVPTAIDQVLEHFDEVDTDQDGAVSREEFSTYADANGLEMPTPPHHHKKPDDLLLEDDDSTEDVSSVTKSNAQGDNGNILAMMIRHYLAGASSYSGVSDSLSLTDVEA